MSDFLVRLARRSAGLTPVVRARSVAPLAATEAPAAEAPAFAPHELPPVPVVVVPPGAAPTVSERGTSHGAPAPVAVAPTEIPIVQRKSTTGFASLAAAVAPAVVLARPAEALPGAPRTPFSRRSAAAVAPAIVPASIARVEPSHEVRSDEVGPDDRRGDVVRESGHALPRSPEPPARKLPGPVVVTIQPVERADPRPHAAPSAGAPERTVHVNIGAIEIHGAHSEPGPQAPVALAPAPVAAPSLPASLAGGFDDYAALRSYAPWAW